MGPEFIILILVISFINWVVGLFKKNEDQDFPEPGERPGRPDQREESEEERVRRFFEALGLPTDQIPAQEPRQPEQPVEQPPPPPVPQHVPVAIPRPSVAQRVPVQDVQTTGEDDEDSSPWSFPAARKAPEERLTEQEKRALAQLKINERREFQPYGNWDKAKRPRISVTTRRYQKLFHDRARLQEAVVIREVLGPPRGLQ